MVSESIRQAVREGVSSAPPMPFDLKHVALSENAQKVFIRRYARRGDDGVPMETVEETFWRVAFSVAKAEQAWGEDVMTWARRFYTLLASKKFFPNSPTFTGAGTPLGQLAACFVLPISDDMGRDSAGIFQTLRDAALIQQTGGGNGFSFSRLRPKGGLVKSSAGQATGPIGFLRVYDHAFGEIAQGGCLLPETLVFTNTGVLRLDEIVNTEVPGWQEHNLSVPTDEGRKLSPRGFNNGVADVLRVYTREGVSIAGTPNHKVKVMTDAGPQWKELQDLSCGDWIVVRLGEHTGELQALKQPSRQHGNQVMPTLPSVLDEELAFFLGYLAGDGFMAQGQDDHRVGASVAHTSYLMKDMPLLLERLFGVRVHKMQKPDDRSATFVMDNRAIKDFLTMNGLTKQTSCDVSVPRLIRQSPANIVGAYLRGLFEADGTLSHGFPSLMTTSSRLACEVSTLLIGLGCPVNIRTISAGLDRWGDSETYQVRINSTVGLEAWREKIGCDQRSRFGAAYAWESDLRKESTYVMPNPRYWLQPVLDDITLEQIDSKGRGRNINFRATEPKLRKQVLRYLRGDRNLTRSGYDLLKAQYPDEFENSPSDDHLWFVRVGGVESAGQSLTLDLEVADNHTYLAYGMVTHNTRRGANMAVLRVDHPDVEEFITCKTNENHITNFNISVGITDAFMRAVKNDEDWELRFPDIGAEEYRGWSGTLEQAERAGMKIRSYGKVRARDLFDKIVAQAHHNGEPGILFLDAANRANPLPHLYKLEATNPCAEQYLGPYENCCLGSINLVEHCTSNGMVDWEELQRSVELSTRFLDDVVEANAYVPAVPRLRQAALDARRIGLGIMGLADSMIHVGVRYGSREGQEFASQVMEFVRYHAMKTSVELAKERGAFPLITGSIYDPASLKWQPPVSLVPYTRNWGRPQLDWSAIQQGIRQHGIRNAAQTTIAPTGTIATVAGCEGYGCEPIFALAYTRHVDDNGHDLQLTYLSPRFEQALQKLGLGEEKRQEIVEQVMSEGTCQHIADLPQSVRDTFVVSADISAEEHVRMQAALQAFVDNSLSKCVTGDTLVLTAHGLAPISALSDMRLPDQFEAREVNIVSPAGIESSDAFYYGGMRETRRVTLTHGFRIEGTPNHRVHILQTDGRADFKRLDELKIGDEVLLYMGQRVFGPESQPLPAYEGELRTNAKKIRFPQRMSVDLAYVLGCITSEGSIGENSLQICNGDRALLENLGKSFESLFGLNSHITKDSRCESVYSLQVNSRPLRNWLLKDLGLEAGARNKIIPNCILRADRFEIAAFLRGLFLDAYMTLDGRMFGIGLASRLLLHQLQTLLLNFGVFSMVHRSGEHAWTLNVSGEALEVLASFVGFVEVWKNERMEIRNEGRMHLRHNYATLLPERVTTNLRQMQENAPKSLRSLFGELPRAYVAHEREYQRARVNLLHGHRLERALARRIFEHFKDHATPFVREFFAGDHQGILYVKVQKIEAGFSEVFDISVPGSHSFVANGMGNHNTINFPETATEQDVASAYLLAWELGCKGLTVYVTGSREKVVLETNATVKSKQATPLTTPAREPPAEQLAIWHETKKPRPRSLPGYTYQIDTPLGKGFVTINENGGEQPFEVFINTAKAGSDTAAVSEAIGRLISYILRLASPVAPRDRLDEVVRQLAGIGGGRSLGFGPNRVRSLPDGVAQVLAEYLANSDVSNGDSSLETSKISNVGGDGYHATNEAALQPSAENSAPGRQLRIPFGDLCPECGQAAVVNEEGCRKCYSCGYNEC